MTLSALTDLQCLPGAHRNACQRNVQRGTIYWPHSPSGCSPPPTCSPPFPPCWPRGHARPSSCGPSDGHPPSGTAAATTALTRSDRVLIASRTRAPHDDTRPEPRIGRSVSLGRGELAIDHPPVFGIDLERFAERVRLPRRAGRYCRRAYELSVRRCGAPRSAPECRRERSGARRPRRDRAYRPALADTTDPHVRARRVAGLPSLTSRRSRPSAPGQTHGVPWPLGQGRLDAMPRRRCAIPTAWAAGSR